MLCFALPTVIGCSSVILILGTTIGSTRYCTLRGSHLPTIQLEAQGGWGSSAWYDPSASLMAFILPSPAEKFEETMQIELMRRVNLQGASLYSSTPVRAEEAMLTSSVGAAGVTRTHDQNEEGGGHQWHNADSSSGSSNACWGAQLTGSKANCSELLTSMSSSRAHFKLKFCPMCTKGLSVKATQVRALHAGLEANFANQKSIGFWNKDMAADTTGYRIINHTSDCIEPKLVVFQGTPPDLDFPPLPVALPSSCARQNPHPSLAGMPPSPQNPPPSWRELTVTVSTHVPSGCARASMADPLSAGDMGQGRQHLILSCTRHSRPGAHPADKANHRGG